MTSRNLRNEQLWKIEKQNEEVAGHNTIVLFGEYDEKEKELTKNDPFDSGYSGSDPHSTGFDPHKPTH
jgi:hypothetical protein